jgi:hypothetical protein
VLVQASGGYGKTEFARVVAEHLATRRVFHEVAWISLQREEFEFTYRRIQTVRVPIEASLDGMERVLIYRLACRSRDDLRGRLREEKTLLVLDNLETLGDAERGGAVAWVRDLLADGPSRAVITSRFGVVAPYAYSPRFRGLSASDAIELLRVEAGAAYPRATPLLRARRRDLLRIARLTDGMPLALHTVVGLCRHSDDLEHVLVTLTRAGNPTAGPDFFRFLYVQAWRELSRPAQALLVYLGTVAEAPQTRGQLLGIEVAPGTRFDRPRLDGALAELSRWFLVERIMDEEDDPEEGEDERGSADHDDESADAGTPGCASGGAHETSYWLHPLTRAFVQSDEARAYWQTSFDEAAMRDAALRRHRLLLEFGQRRSNA